MTHKKYLNRIVALAVSTALVSLPAVAQTDNADKVFNQAKALGMEVAETVGPLYTYDITFKAEDLQATGTVNLAAEEGQRLVVHSPSSDQWSEEFAGGVSEFEKTVGEDLWCQELMEDVGDYSTVALTPEGMVFDVALKFDPDEKEEVKFARNMEVKVTLSSEDGAVLAYSMYAPKPFRPVLIAKIKKFELNIECERAPNGRTYAKHMRTNVEGRAMMKNFHEQEARTISNVRLP